MCGICGFTGLGQRRDLQAIMAALLHRGPDAGNSFVDPLHRVYLGHRRLAILDLQGGSQPMWNEDGQVGVIFNGEIYNHLELRQQLQRLGHVFRSANSDTEVLVHGYEEWGEELPIRLNGMFAFAIYDRRRGCLFLARDRFGKKPLYYCQQPDLFAFASELTALARHPLIDRTLDPRAIRKLFAYGFIPSPNALYRGTRKLPGGHSLTVDLRSGGLTQRCYWEFHLEAAASPVGRTEQDWAEELHALLAQAVRRRLAADVPVGMFLSGGLDSSTLLVLAAAQRPAQELKTFSIGFDEPSYDESGHARRVADLVGAVHHEQTLTIDLAWELLHDFVPRLDEPLGDSSFVPTCLLAQFARREVTVALSGDGGDELFAGYDPFHALGPAAVYNRLVPSPLHRFFRWLGTRLPLSASNMSLDFILRRWLRGLSYQRPLWNPIWLGPLEPPELAELFQEPIDLEDLYAEALAVWEQSDAPTLRERTLEFYTRLYLPDNILVKVDRASMLHSLEARCPFLDNDVVEFARRLPTSLKYRRGQTKYLLKLMMRGRLPQSIIQRRKKGFGMPLGQWLRDWSGFLDLANVPPLNSSWLRERWRQHQEGRADHRQLLWCDLVLQKHVEQRRAADRPSARPQAAVSGLAAPTI